MYWYAVDRNRSGSTVQRWASSQSGSDNSLAEAEQRRQAHDSAGTDAATSPILDWHTVHRRLLASENHPTNHERGRQVLSKTACTGHCRRNTRRNQRLDGTSPGIRDAVGACRAVTLTYPTLHSASVGESVGTPQPAPVKPTAVEPPPAPAPTKNGLTYAPVPKAVNSSLATAPASPSYTTAPSSVRTKVPAPAPAPVPAASSCWAKTNAPEPRWPQAIVVSSLVD